MAYNDERLSSIYNKTDGYCHLCDKKLSWKNYGIHGAKGSWHVDHSKAKANGGTDHMNNLFASCISCNLEKGTLHKNTIRKRKGYTQEDSSGCFITTACVVSNGLPDNCYELEVLRKFRDEFVISRTNGKELINEYYKTAPLIVQQINGQENANSIYSDLYKDIKLAVSLIKAKKNIEAFNLYCKLTIDLKEKYLSNSN